MSPNRHLAAAPPARPATRLRCEGAAARLFFSDEPEELEAAKSLCSACPAQRQCLTGALERREPWGVWGGELFDAGRVVERKRRPGRPRKVPAASPAIRSDVA